MNGGERRPRVLVGVHGGGLTGIDTYAEHLARAAVATGAEVFLAVTTPAVAAAMRARVGDEVAVFDLGLDAPTPCQRRLFRLSPRAASLYLERALGPALAAAGRRFDVAHLNHPPLAASAGGAARSIVVAGWFHPHSIRGRLVETWRHTGRRFPRSALMGVKALAHHRNDRRGYRKAAAVTTPTDALASALRRRGLDARRLSPPANRPAAELREPEHAEADGRLLRLVVCAGDLGHPRKNVRAAVATAGVLCERGHEVALTLVGGRSESLRRDLDRLPREVTIDVAGILPPEEVAARLRAADVLLLPSLFEEWGYVAVEAALQGTPVVALPVYPFTEMLEPPFGRTATALTPAAMAAAVEETRAAVARRAAVAAAVDARFGIEATAAALTALWSDIL